MNGKSNKIDWSSVAGKTAAAVMGLITAAAQFPAHWQQIDPTGVVAAVQRLWDTNREAAVLLAVLWGVQAFTKRVHAPVVKTAE